MPGGHPEGDVRPRSLVPPHIAAPMSIQDPVYPPQVDYARFAAQERAATAAKDAFVRRIQHAYPTADYIHDSIIINVPEDIDAVIDKLRRLLGA